MIVNWRADKRYFRQRKEPFIENGVPLEGERRIKIDIDKEDGEKFKNLSKRLTLLLGRQIPIMDIGSEIVEYILSNPHILYEMYEEEEIDVRGITDILETYYE